jgi:hypothetical protein
MSMTPTTPTAAPRGPWRRWLDFWFAAGDPTTLGFIRVVTGCLVLYVHLAYSFDLQSFFGPNGWYSLESINRERWEMPHVIGPLNWDEGDRTATIPEYAHRKKPVMAYIRHTIETYPTRAEMDRALAFLERLQQSKNNALVLEGLAYLERLSPEAIDRKNQLAVLADEGQRAAMENSRVPKLLIPPEPPFVQGMTPEQRKTLAAEVEAFYETLPRGLQQQNIEDREYILAHLAEMDIAGRAAFLKFLRDLTALSPEEQSRWLGYLEHWHMESRIAHRLGNPIFSLWFHVTDPVGMAVAHSVVLVIIVLFTVGFCTRVTSVLLWLAAISYIHRTQQVLFGMDTMMNILLFYLMIGNCGAALSVDRLIRRYRVVKASLRRSGTIDPAAAAYLAHPPASVSASFATRLIQVHFCFIYMASGLAKLKGPAWWNTNAYWDTLVNPEFTMVHYQWYEFLVRQLVETRLLYAIVAAFGVGFTLFTEIGLPFLVWTRARPFAILCSCLLHFGIAVFMGLWIFSLMMMTMVLSYLPGVAIRERLFGEPAGGRLLVRYNARSERQTRAAALARAFDLENRVEPTPGSTAATVRVDADGQELSGAAAVAALFNRVNGLRPFRWLLRVPGIGVALTRRFSGAEPEPTAPVSKPGVPAAS